MLDPRQSSFSKFSLLPLALLFLIASSAGAANQNAKNNNFATLQAFGNSIYWSIHPSVHYQSIKLTLSSNSGTPIEIESEQEPTTGALEDGEYTYELVVTPSLGPSVRAQLKAARESAGGQEAASAVRNLKSQGKIPQHRQIQSGYFRLSNGQLVTADAAQE